MKKYDYRAMMREDVKHYIRFNYDGDELDNMLRYDDERESFIEELYDVLWTEDSVTGNASGSYTFSIWIAEEYLCHNLDLLREALAEFGNTKDTFDILTSPERCDVTIRCYLLSEVIRDVIWELMMNHGIPEINDYTRESLNWESMEEM